MLIYRNGIFLKESDVICGMYNQYRIFCTVNNNKMVQKMQCSLFFYENNLMLVEWNIILPLFYQWIWHHLCSLKWSKSLEKHNIEKTEDHYKQEGVCIHLYSWMVYFINDKHFFQGIYRFVLHNEECTWINENKSWINYIH